MLKRQEVLKLVGEGLGFNEIAQRLGIGKDSVVRAMKEALRTESIFPSSLSSEKIAEMRQIEGEQLAAGQRKVVVAMNTALKVMMEAESLEVKLTAVATVARCHESLTRSSERKSRLWGLDMPQKLITETLQINLERSEKRVTISFDGSVYDEPTDSIPGLQIFQGTEAEGQNGIDYNNGANGLPPHSEAPAVATEIPREGETA